MSIYGEMLKYRGLAIRAHCRVVRWKLTEAQAWQLVEECAPFEVQSPKRLYAILTRGDTRVLGALVEIFASAKSEIV